MGKMRTVLAVHEVLGLDVWDFVARDSQELSVKELGHVSDNPPARSETVILSLVL